jgi:hypothetical protein
MPDIQALVHRAPAIKHHRGPDDITSTWASAPCVCQEQIPEEHTACWTSVSRLG